MEDVAPLFAQGGEVGADGAEGLNAGDGTETPGVFCLSMDMRISCSGLSKGTRESARKRRTSSACWRRRSRRLTAGDCLIRPRCLWVRAQGALSRSPWAMEWLRIGG